MTTITVKKDNGDITAFTVEGHSGYGEEGSDIVCAGISAVVWTVINGLTEIAGLPARYETREGYTACSIPSLSKEKRMQANLLLDSMMAFLRSLAEQYAEFVRITEV